MSTLSIAAFFRFRGVRIVGQTVSDSRPLTLVKLAQDQRFRPCCHACGTRASWVHSKGYARLIRDLDLAGHQTWLQIEYRKIACPRCDRIRVENLAFCEAGMRMTHRLANYVAALCAMLTVEEVARHLQLDSKTVKAIDKAHLETEFGQTDYSGLEILAVDEVAVKKGQNYMTVVLDYTSGRVVWMGQDRTFASLAEFFEAMSAEQRMRIKAVAMDMWHSYMRCVRRYCPKAKIVFDMFHVLKAYSKVIDTIRRAEFRKAPEEDREAIKGSRFLLLKNAENLSAHQQSRLARLLALNQTLSAVYILKEQLRALYTARDKIKGWLALLGWCRTAKQLGHPAMDHFIRMLQRHQEGILNYYDYPIGTNKLEGTINKIKVIKRKAYGFHDTRYFALKVMQAFPGG